MLYVSNKFQLSLQQLQTIQYKWIYYITMENNLKKINNQ